MRIRAYTSSDAFTCAYVHTPLAMPSHPSIYRHASTDVSSYMENGMTSCTSMCTCMHPYAVVLCTMHIHVYMYAPLCSCTMHHAHLHTYAGVFISAERRQHENYIGFEPRQVRNRWYTCLCTMHVYTQACMYHACLYTSLHVPCISTPLVQP